MNRAGSDPGSVSPLTKEIKGSTITKIKKGATAMAVHHSLFNMITVQQRVEVVQTLPGLYCRTQISE